jgi:tRNA(Ile)-lysidine synthase
MWHAVDHRGFGTPIPSTKESVKVRLPLFGNMSTHDRVLVSIRTSEALEPGRSVLALLSGGADSVCLVHSLRELLGEGALVALHVNHGLRAGADEDERFCVALCESLGIELEVERVIVPGHANLEARAREARYAAAELVRERRGLELIATGHTASDQVETILYRLASSPGRRALLGMERRSGRLIRPLLDVTGEQTRQYCEDAGLPWREDETNLDRRFARNRIRHEVLPALREVHPAVEENVLATAEQLREEAELLESLLDSADEQAGAGGWPPAVEAARLRELPRGLRRLLLRRLAEQAAGAALPVTADQVRQMEELATRGGSASLDIGSGVRVTSEYGVLRFGRLAEETVHEEALLTVPGLCRFGDWELVCEVEPVERSPAPYGASLDEAALDAGKLAGTLAVRPWRDGDCMSPLGLDGTKSLQDLFTDKKVPRSLRRSLPVVESEGEIVWVAGVALSERFKITSGTRSVARIRARSAESGSRPRESAGEAFS